MISNFAVFAFAAVILVKSAQVTIKALTKLAIFFKLSEFAVGFILMALATTLPELFVGLTAAFEKRPILSLGNVLGSNIADLTLVIGLAALVSGGFRVESTVRKRDVFYMSVMALAPLILLGDKTLSRNDGLLLLLLYLSYLFRLFSRRQEYTKKLEKRARKEDFLKNLGLFSLGVLLLVASADIMVKSASSLATALGVPLILIGLLVIAVGTSLPELMFSTEAILAHHNPMVMGDILGSVVTNSTLILGLTALIEPIKVVHFSLFAGSALFTVLTLLVFAAFIRSQSKLSLVEGFFLIFLYIAFLLTEFSLQSQM